MSVTVHSLPTKCTACESTELALKSIPHETVIMDVEMSDRFKADGLLAAPVVVVDVGDGVTWTWAGYRHNEIKRLKELFKDSLPEVA